jgi:hypothetical protein
MDRIIISDALKTELDGHFGPVELIDATGLPLGQFLPQFVKLQDDGCPYTERELEQARAEHGGRPLKEIWKSLGVR